MNIQTSLNVGDRMYLIHDNRIIQAPVTGISINVFDGHDDKSQRAVVTTTEYEIIGKKVSITQLFRTKKALLDHLAERAHISP